MDLEIKSTPMICGSAEAEEREYHMYKENNGCIWLVSISDNAADNIYCGYDHDTKSQGFGGSWLKFKITEEDREIKLQGPWHTNADSLYRAVGVDVRNQRLTQVIISKGVTYGKNGFDKTLKDVVSFLSDGKPKIGLFNRGKKLAQDYADFMEMPVYLHTKSSGGSSAGWIWPEETTHKDWTRNEKSGKMDTVI